MANDWPEIPVSPPRVSAIEGGSRLTADVLGEALWFETNAPLRASEEALSTALLPIAAGANSPLLIDRPLDPVWRRGAARILRAMLGGRAIPPAG